jgi:hypothetical protein
MGGGLFVGASEQWTGKRIGKHDYGEAIASLDAKKSRFYFYNGQVAVRQGSAGHVPVMRPAKRSVASSSPDMKIIFSLLDRPVTA